MTSARPAPGTTATPAAAAVSSTTASTTTAAGKRSSAASSGVRSRSASFGRRKAPRATAIPASASASASASSSPSAVHGAGAGRKRSRRRVRPPETEQQRLRRLERCQRLRDIHRQEREAQHEVFRRSEDRHRSLSLALGELQKERERLVHMILNRHKRL